ncbi:MAG: hypothetical protein AB8I08_33165 [Sandaracinaceae bacterium]
MDVLNAILIGLWAAFAISVVMRLRRRGERAFASPMRPTDRRLVGATAFYLAVPAWVLLSQLTQILMLELLDNGLGAASTVIYWGHLEPAVPEALTPLGRAGVAATGPVVMMLGAGLAFSLVALRPQGAARNALLVESGRLLLMLAFGIWPVVSLLRQEGDVWAFREALETRHAGSGDLALLGYGILGAYAFFRWRRAHALRVRTTPAHDEAREAAAALAERPNDAHALHKLGQAQLSVRDPRAVDTLRRAHTLAPDDPAMELALGRALLREGAASDASAHLRRAGQRLEDEGEDEDLLFEVTLSLSAARMALGDLEGALLTAQEAEHRAPRNPRAWLMITDVLAASGDRAQAKQRLEAGFQGGDRALEREIQRRLDRLRRR